MTDPFTARRCRLGFASLLLMTAAVHLSAPALHAGELALSLEGGYLDITNARKSARAVFDDSAGGFTGGGTLRYGFSRRLFLGAGAHYFERTGERVFVTDPHGTVFRLGHPLTVRLIPAYALLGYRFIGRRGRSPLVPYLALGPGITSYHEESLIGGLKEGVVSRTKASGHAAGGLEYGRGAFRFGVEVMYSLVPDSVGVGGVSKVYNEKDVGGFTALGKIVLVP